MMALMVMVVIVVIMVMMTLVVVVVIVVVMMVVAALVIIVVVLFCFLPVVLLQQGGKLCGDGVFPLDGVQYLAAGDGLPVGGDDDGVGVLLPQLADWTWLLKNSPKFFMYILALAASTTVVRPPSTNWSPADWTAATISDSLPTPEGSMRMRSGSYSRATIFRASRKSPVRLQQMQPDSSSFTTIPASFKKPPSMPISPNSFSMRTSFSPAYPSARSFLMRVVFPAPKNPENMSILVMCMSPFW